MSAEDRRYRVRFGFRGVEELVDGSTVDFALLLTDLAGVPVVTGSVAKPIQGSTEMRPLTVLAVDAEGVQTGRFANDKAVEWVWLDLCPGTRGRWDMVGRLLDIQWQASSADPDVDPWTTYGTGRCSGFGEGAGPGQYQIEISDETWKIRKHVPVFEFADTTQLWPAAVRPGRMDPEPASLPSAWRGLRKIRPAQGEVVETVGQLHRIHLTAFTADPGGDFGLDFSQTMRGGIILDRLLRWIQADRKDSVTFVDDIFPEGNFRYLRLGYGPLEGTMEDYEVVAFGETLPEAETEEDRIREMFAGLEEPSAQFQDIDGVQTELDIWVRSRENVDGISTAPPSEGEFAQMGFLWAPEAPPSNELPLHLGVNNPDHAWGTDGGYLHVADLHRRGWSTLGLRYDEANLAMHEADLSFPAVATTVGDDAENPEEVLARIRQNCGLISLRDPHGRLTLVDVRPVREVDFSTLPRVDNTNTQKFRWRVKGRETKNVLEVETLRTQYADIEVMETDLARVEGMEPESTPGLDLVQSIPRTDFYRGDTITDTGERRQKFHARHVLEPAALSRRKVDLMSQERGALWEDVADELLMGWLELYQDGLWRCTFERYHVPADDEAEGDLLLLDHESLQVPHPVTRERSGESVIRLLSITRHPTHAECEAILIPAIDVLEFEETCPEEE